MVLFSSGQERASPLIYINKKCNFIGTAKLSIHLEIPMMLSSPTPSSEKKTNCTELCKTEQRWFSIQFNPHWPSEGQQIQPRYSQPHDTWSGAWIGGVWAMYRSWGSKNWEKWRSHRVYLVTGECSVSFDALPQRGENIFNCFCRVNEKGYKVTLQM